MNAEHLAQELVGFACDKLSLELAQIERCVRLLDRRQLWHRENPHTNSVANLVLHLTGNVRQWVVAGIGGETFTRDRPAEFAACDMRRADELLPPLTQTVRRAIEILRGLDAAALLKRRLIQGYDVSTLAAVFHVVEHFSFHTGQIVHRTKVFREVDLSLHDAQGHRRAGQGP